MIYLGLDKKKKHTDTGQKGGCHIFQFKLLKKGANSSPSFYFVLGDLDLVHKF